MDRGGLEDGPKRRRFIAALIAGLFVLLHAGLAWRFRAPGLTTGQDDAIYLLLGQALKAGTYRDLWLVEAPFESRYPPFYPAVLALLVGDGGPDAVERAMLLNVALSAGALVLTFMHIRPHSAPLAALVVAVAAINPALVRAAGEVRSEPLFMFLTLAALWLLRRPDPSPGTLVAAGTTAIAAALTRSIGIVLLPAVVLPWLAARRWRAAALFSLAALLTVGAWAAWLVAAPVKLAGESYVADALLPHPPRDATETTGLGATGPGQSRDSAEATAPDTAAVAASPSSLPGRLAARIRHNVPAFLARRVPAVLAFPTVPGTPVDNLLAVVLLALGGLPGLVLLARHSGAAAIYLAGYAALLAVWPYPLTRFLVPVVPMLLVLLFAGFAALPRLFRLGSRWWAALPVALLLAVGAVTALLRREREVARCDRVAPVESPGCFNARQRAFFQMVQQADWQLPADAVLLTPKAATLHYLTRRRTVHELRAASLGPRALARFLERRGVTHVLLSRVHADQRAIAQNLAAGCAGYTLLAQAGAEAVLLVVPRASQGAARDAPRDGPGTGACEAIAFFSDSAWGGGE
jgi:hypothetical protein